MNLYLGRMPIKDLIKWFGVSESTFRHNKGRYLEDLGDYCEFEVVYGGVLVKKIYEPAAAYQKKRGEQRELVKKHFEEEWDKSGLDSSQNVANKIILKYGNDITVKDGTIYRYALAARNDLYGKPFQDFGQHGRCIYQWCKETDEQIIDGKKVVDLVPFTPAEEEIKKNLMQKYFSTDAEKEILVAQMVDAGEISKADAYDLTRELKNLTGAGFMAFKSDLEAAIGYKVTRGTYLIKRGEKTPQLTFE